MPVARTGAGWLLLVQCLGQPAWAQTAETPVVTIKKELKPARAEPKAAEPVKPEPPSTPGGPADASEMATITVAAERPTNRIDRQVYDVKSDVGSSNGSAADALNNVPSVNVDPDGSVSLRGSSNVQILIDGKPSAMMQGDNRGASLSAIPAEDIESVEVINNPGAQFGNEAGGGPIINLVMRRSRRPGGFGVINANAGAAGRYNTAISGTYNQGLFGLQGGLNFRHDGRNSVASIIRDRIDPLTGEAIHSTQDSHSAGLNDNAGLNGALSYNVGAKDTLAANLSYSTRTNDQQSEDHYVLSAPDSSPASDYVRTTHRSGDSRNYGWGARWDHKGALDGETLKLDLRVSSADNSADSRYTNLIALSQSGAVDSKSAQDNGTGNKIIDFTGDYERPAGAGVLKLGYKIAENRNHFDTLYTNIDPVTLDESVNTLRSNRFRLNENNLALYASYQLRLNEQWGMLAGLRAEYTDLDLHQLTTQIDAGNNYVNYIPSFFASYKASSDTTLRFSYAHRIKRPNANDLNPFVIYRDEVNVSSGNPKLKPTETDSFELGYETHFGAIEANLRGYYRKDSDAILDRKYFISDTVLLTTRENGGGTHASGMEFTLSGKLMPKLSLNASGNLARNEQRILDLEGAENKRTASSLSGRMRLNFQATDVDQLQAMVNVQGKTLAGQGIRQPNTTANFSLRHALTPKLNLVFNVTDAFDANKTEIITDTSTLKESSVRRFDGRLVYVGLSYRIGGFTPPSRGDNSATRSTSPR
jgi:outer membrane receptor protein involved in Fe transport